MAIELVPGPLWFTPRTNCHRDHEVRGPQKTYFKAYIVHRHGPMGFTLGRGKRGAMVRKKARAHGKELLR